MRLDEAILKCTDRANPTMCITSARYKERCEFVEVRDINQTLMLRSWALPTQGTTWCPTLGDLFTNTWEVFYPEQYNKDAQ